MSEFETISAKYYTYTHCDSYPKCHHQCRGKWNYKECFVGNPYNVCITAEFLDNCGEFVRISVAKSDSPRNIYTHCKKTDEKITEMTDIVIPIKYVDYCIKIFEMKETIEQTKKLLCEQKNELSEYQSNLRTAFPFTSDISEEIEQKKVQKIKTYHESIKQCEEYCDKGMPREALEICKKIDISGNVFQNEYYDKIKSIERRCHILIGGKDGILSLQFSSDVNVIDVFFDKESTKIKELDEFASMFYEKMHEKSFHEGKPIFNMDYLKKHYPDDKIQTIEKYLNKYTEMVTSANSQIFDKATEIGNLAIQEYESNDFYSADLSFFRYSQEYKKLKIPKKDEYKKYNNNIKKLSLYCDLKYTASQLAEPTEQRNIYFKQSFNNHYVELSEFINVFPNNVWPIFVLDKIFIETDFVNNAIFVKLIKELYHANPFKSLDEYNNAADCQYKLNEDDWKNVDAYVKKHGLFREILGYHERW